MLCEDIGVATVVVEEVFKKKWIVILTLFIALCCFFSFKLRPIIQSITATVAKQAITLSVEEAIKEKISAQGIEYNDFVEILSVTAMAIFWVLLPIW